MSKTADQNLLIGVIAVQMEFISRDQFVSALGAWLLEKHTSLDELLLKHHFVDKDTQQILLSLVNKHLEIHGGDPRSSLAAVGKPLDVEELNLESLNDKEIIASVASIGTYVSSNTDATPHDDLDPTMTLGQSTSDGTRFQTLRPHAKGGLGQVWVARDRELNREVALKEIQLQYADHDENRARFVVEAEITGSLEHPGIVPVYGLGTYEDGRPYYAMRLIHGKSLRDATDHFFSKVQKGKWSRIERALEMRKLLAQFVDVCNALEYAHSRGIIHRDLKPQNIMLGQFGETMVVDWGLAKPIDTEHEDFSEDTRIEPSSLSGVNPTIMGRAVGTPAYMSPEQAAGRQTSIGVTTDVYGLGATLYYLLTGAAPFSDSDTGSMLRHVVEGDFPAPREQRPGVSKPLEAICLNAMARRPEDRYSSPKLLAEDVERALGGQPPLAWNEPATAKLGRWFRQHYKIAVPSTAALLIVSLVITYVVMDRNQRDASIRRQVDTLMMEARRTMEAGEEEAGMRLMSLASGVSSSSATFARDKQAIDEELSQRARLRDFKREAQLVVSNGISYATSSGHLADRDPTFGLKDEADAQDAIVLECNRVLTILGIEESDEWRQAMKKEGFSSLQIEEVSRLVSEVYLVKALRNRIRGKNDPGPIESALVALDYAEEAGEAGIGIYMLRMLLNRAIGRDELADEAGDRMTELAQQSVTLTTLDYYLTATITHHLMNNPEGAIASYERVLARRPDHYGAAFGLFICYDELEDRRAAAEALNVCLALRPGIGDLYLFRGYSHFASGKYALAKDIFERGLSINPENGFVGYFKGRSEIMLSEWAEAADSFSEAFVTDPALLNRISWLALSRAHVPEQYREAIDAVEKALARDDADGGDRWRCARTYALCSGAALEIDNDHVLADECRTKAVQLLRQGLMDGSVEPSQLMSGDLDPIKDSEEYAELVEEFPFDD